MQAFHKDGRNSVTSDLTAVAYTLHLKLESGSGTRNQTQFYSDRGHGLLEPTS